MDNLKCCNKCGAFKALDEFTKHKILYSKSGAVRGYADGRDYTCKICNREYYQTHKEKMDAYSKKYAVIHPPTAIQRAARLERQKADYMDPLKRRRIKNSINASTKQRYYSDIEYRLRRCALTSFKKLFMRGAEQTFTAKYGYTKKMLRNHLERLWLPSMTWENYGGRDLKKTWCIDHIIPLSKQNDHNALEIWSLNNLQPLWQWDNLKKGNR